MKVDGYIRVSEVGGRGGESYGSPTEQLAAIRQWCDQNGATLHLVETDEDVSGAKDADLRKLGKLIQRCEDGNSDGIVAYHSDRFSREHPLQNMLTRQRVEEAGAFFIGIVDGYDSRREAALGQLRPRQGRP